MAGVHARLCATKFIIIGFKVQYPITISRLWWRNKYLRCACSDPSNLLLAIGYAAAAAMVFDEQIPSNVGEYLVRLMHFDWSKVVGLLSLYRLRAPQGLHFRGAGPGFLFNAPKSSETGKNCRDTG